MKDGNMMISDEEQGIISDILDHAAAGTTHMLPEMMLNPVTNYYDQTKFDREVEVLFRRFPIIVGHVSQLAEPGDFFTHDDTGVPILITRTQDGEIKAFLNVCRHRGARLANEPCGKARTFSCPYHAWTYGLDGRLRGMPQPVGFNGIDKSKLSLVDLPCFERFGMIWVVPSVTEDEIDIDAWLAPMAAQLEGLTMDSHVVYEEWTLHRNMSWRIALEGFQESYHFCSAHATTACSGYLDNQSVHLNFYPHVRHAVPMPNIEELRGKDPAEWDYRPYFMTQNYLFPANFIQVMTDHIYVHTIIPTGKDTCIFKCMMLIAEAPASEKAERYWKKNYDLIRVVFNEDFEIGEGIQKGLETGANSAFVFGTFECGLHFGQTAIDDALDGKLTVPKVA